MKIIVTVNNYSSDKATEARQGWYILPDSSMTNTGKPFYKPDILGKITVSLGMAVRIQRLGKHIDSKFASRYYSEYAPVLHFKAPQLEKKLRDENLPCDAAWCFDRSLFVGDFEPMENVKSLILISYGKEVSSFDIRNLIVPVDRLIENFSIINTIKMGDILVAGLSEETEIEIGDLFEVLKGDETAFHVKIK